MTGLEDSMTHSVPHDLGPEKAKQVAEAALATYSEKFAQYSPQIKWVGDRRAEISFTVKGFALKGLLEVNTSNIDLDLDVPFVLRPFKGTAINVIEQEIKSWIAKAKSGQL
jgi:hypothetical protein